MLATTGVVGLVIYVGIIARTLFILVQRVIKKSDDYWSKMILLSFLLYFFHSQTNVISISEEIIFWLIVGIASSQNVKLLDKRFPKS